MAAGKRRAAYAAFLPLLMLALRALLLSDSPGRGGEETLASRYVVRFLEYRPADDHREYLEDGLRPAWSWRWVERRNPAAAYPTDFAVLEIRDAHRDAVFEAVRALGRVRDVHPDTSHSRGALSADRAQRRGKRFTAMSFEEEGRGDDDDAVSSNNGSSSSGSRRRKLQMRVRFSWYSATHGRNIYA